MKNEKILLILGASSDMGQALIRETADNYKYILAHYNHGNDEFGKLCAEYPEKIVPLKADLTNEEQITEMISTIENTKNIPDHIVHFAAAKTENKKFVKHVWSEYDDAITTSLKPFVLILQKLIPYMQKQHYGKIITVLSSCTIGVPPKYQSPYVSLKYALLGLTKTLAVEYADKGITVNGVSPDMVETKFLDNIPSLILEQNAQKSPISRNLQVEDVIPTIMYLLGDGADTITGQNILISGGKV